MCPLLVRGLRWAAGDPIQPSAVMLRFSFSCAALLLLLVAAPAYAQHDHGGWTSGRPDGHAPIGVMGDHTHGAGEFMLSYRYMVMAMEGNRDGTDGVDAEAVVAPDGYGFNVTPTEMPMQMHMAGAMYAPTDALTLMAMLPYTVLDMDHLTRMGGTFSTHAEGLGDLKLTALYELARFGDQQVHLNAGLSLPTGSIDEEGVTPASAPEAARLPYPMQLGSGTLNLLPGLTYLGQAGDLSWGAQGKATVRLGENERDYRFGNRYAGTAWAARRLSNVLSASLRLEGQTWEDVSGTDPAYATAVDNRMVPTVFADLRAGTRLDAGLGVNLYVPGGPLAGFRLAAEALLPVYQDLDGPQLETDVQLVVGAQYAF